MLKDFSLGKFIMKRYNCKYSANQETLYAKTAGKPCIRYKQRSVRKNEDVSATLANHAIAATYSPVQRDGAAAEDHAERHTKREPAAA